MRKIISFMLIYMLLTLGICNAEIRRGVDSFTGGIAVFNEDKSEKINEIPELESLYFRKIIDYNNCEYYIEAENDVFEDRILSDNDVEIKIDDKPVYILERKKYKKFSPINYKITAILTVSVAMDIVNDLKDAKRVALRFTQKNGNQFVYVLPNETLIEWKQVIATKE